jgi:hydroxyethylthiazole kinase
MAKVRLDAYALLRRIKATAPVVHHLTNWVTIYDCANVVKVLGASPVMAHAREEVAQMTNLAQALVLNIGTLTVDLVEAMGIAARAANTKSIPVVLDACGAGATDLRDQKSLALLEGDRIDIIKGNASEIARLGGENVKTKGVDAAEVHVSLLELAQDLALTRGCTVVVTGPEDVVTDGGVTYRIKNGHPMMGHVVGTGCMAASVIGTFAAVEPDLALAAACALVCFEVAAECAVQACLGPGSFKQCLYDYLYHLDKETIDRLQQVERCEAIISSRMPA